MSGRVIGTIVAVLILAQVSAIAGPQTRPTRPQQAMTKWIGKYPDGKFFNQPQIKAPLRRILSKADYESIGDYNLMVPIKRVGDYLLTYASIKYSDPLESLNLAYNLKDNAVYVVFWKGEQHRKFSTKNNEFDLPDEVLEELGLKDE
jgi:hypothetical protein